jgi:hypothetical protein
LRLQTTVHVNLNLNFNLSKSSHLVTNTSSQLKNGKSPAYPLKGPLGAKAQAQAQAQGQSGAAFAGLPRTPYNMADRFPSIEDIDAGMTLVTFLTDPNYDLEA